MSRVIILCDRLSIISYYFILSDYASFCSLQYVLFYSILFNLIWFNIVLLILFHFLHYSQFCQSGYCWVRVHMCSGLCSRADSTLQTDILEVSVIRGKHALSCYEQRSILSHSHPRVPLCLDHSSVGTG